MSKNAKSPKAYEFTSEKYKIGVGGEGFISSLSIIKRARVDSVVSFCSDNILKVVDDVTAPNGTLWFRMYCDGLPSGDRYILVDPECTKFMPMLKYDIVKQQTVLRLTAYDREILSLAVGLYMCDM